MVAEVYTEKGAIWAKAGGGDKHTEETEDREFHAVKVAQIPPTLPSHSHA